MTSDLITDALNDISETVVHNTVGHTKKVGPEYRKSDGLDASPIQEKVVIDVAAESSESTDSFSSESY